MKSWLDNAKLFWYADDYGICPDCGSANIKAEKLCKGEYMSVSFLCLDCGSMDNYYGKAPKKQQ